MAVHALPASRIIQRLMHSSVMMVCEIPVLFGPCCRSNFSNSDVTCFLLFLSSWNRILGTCWAPVLAFLGRFERLVRGGEVGSPNGDCKGTIILVCFPVRDSVPAVLCVLTGDVGGVRNGGDTLKSSGELPESVGRPCFSTGEDVHAVGRESGRPRLSVFIASALTGAIPFPNDIVFL